MQQRDSETEREAQASRRLRRKPRDQGGGGERASAHESNSSFQSPPRMPANWTQLRRNGLPPPPPPPRASPLCSGVVATARASRLVRPRRFSSAPFLASRSCRETGGVFVSSPSRVHPNPAQGICRLGCRGSLRKGTPACRAQAQPRMAVQCSLVNKQPRASKPHSPCTEPWRGISESIPGSCSVARERMRLPGLAPGGETTHGEVVPSRARAEPGIFHG